MNKRLFFLIALLAVNAMLWTGCKKEEDLVTPKGEGKKSPEELQEEFLQQMGSDYDIDAWKQEWYRPDIIPSGTKKVMVKYPFIPELVPVEAQVVDGMVVLGGDMVLGTEAEVDRVNSEVASRGVVIDGFDYRWPYGIIPVKDYSAHPNASRIAEAIRHIDDLTNLRFVSYTDQSSYIQFVHSTDGNYVYGPGRYTTGGGKGVYITSDAPMGTVIHELLHIAGMYHEQARCDRDDHINVNWNNIKNGWADQFYKICDGATDVYNYDYGSIMHYHAYAASGNGKPTMTPDYFWPWEYFDRMGRMGQRNGMSETDISTINHLYPIVDNQTYSLLQVYPSLLDKRARLGMESTGPNSPLIVNTWRGHSAQRFRFVPATDGYYYIEDVVSGQVLDVSGGSTGDKVNVILYPRHNGHNQQFRLNPVTWGSYTLIARHSGKEISSVMRVPGQKIQQKGNSADGWFQIFRN